MKKVCVFCNINCEKFRILWENKKFVAFLDQYPSKPGHTLIIPKKHCDYIFDLSSKEYLELFNIVKKLSHPIKKAMKVKRITLDVDGFWVDHCHVHLVPANRGYSFCNLRRKKVKDEDLVKIAEKIKKEIKKVNF